MFPWQYNTSPCCSFYLTPPAVLQHTENDAYSVSSVRGKVKEVGCAVGGWVGLNKVVELDKTGPSPWGFLLEEICEHSG